MQTLIDHLQKAFDSVLHPKLISKLLHLDIPLHLVAWVSSFLFLQQQQVVVSGSTSSPVNVPSGVPQGSVLGPLLFLIYIDCLFQLSLRDSHLSIFADDILLYRIIRVISDFLVLNADVYLLTSWLLKTTSPSVSLNVNLFGFPVNLCLQFPILSWFYMVLLLKRFCLINILVLCFHQIPLGVAMSLVFA